ncbi:MAG: NAAT family transporter [Proteobacteria bacterium]|nr:NAAT family transporter [Pseudomonadota bacterium]
MGSYVEIKILLMSFASSFTAVFAIVDPVAVIPVFLSLTERLSVRDRALISRKACVIAACILAVFALFGEGIFHLFGISMPAFRIAGGILLLLLGIAQLNAHRVRVKTEEENESMAREDISIFPLATPLLAGPGAISTVVLQASQTKGPLALVIFLTAIGLVFVSSYFFLKSAPYLYRLLGKTGINLVTRIMGIILTAIAVQFMIDGVRGILQNIKGI